MYIRALRSHGMVPTKNTQSILIACGVLKIYDLIRGDIHPIEHNTLSVRHCDEIIKFNSNTVHENQPYRHLSRSTVYNYVRRRSCDNVMYRNLIRLKHGMNLFPKSDLLSGDTSFIDFIGR